MENNKKEHNKRVRKLAMLLVLVAIILSLSTYAWFIGNRVARVSAFDIEIAATESLLLSLDGENFSPRVTIDSDNYITDSYTGNTNWWTGGKGLIPMSSVGDIDEDASRLTLFEKASLTATPGGYRLMASRVLNGAATDLVYGAPNPAQPEQDGYVAFDLFVKNFSGTQYIVDYNERDEEAIYLTTNSAVSVATSGVENTGIENSVRVAFAQLGRVIGTSDLDGNYGDITGITCADDVSGNTDVTGICAEKRATIWEPNDTKHVDAAISWYETSCKARKSGVPGENLTLASAYDGPCEPIEPGKAYPTYAVAKEIKSTDRVDVYDGEAYNTYEKTTDDELLEEVKSFTDTDKMLRGVYRPTFMTLAPNSITKVRVYVYLEGQDIDNYDFASIGKAISVKFGFTKERFIEEDVQYNGPDLNDGLGPVIEIDSTPVSGSIKMDVSDWLILDLATDITATGMINEAKDIDDMAVTIRGTGSVAGDKIYLMATDWFGRVTNVVVTLE